MSADEQHSTLGEHLFPRVSAVVRRMDQLKMAAKVTGMLLHTADSGALLTLLDDDAMLETAVHRALQTIEPLLR